MKVIDIFSHWDQVRADLISMIDRFEDAELRYEPFPSSWTVGKILLHIAAAEEGWFQYVVRKEYDQWPAEFEFQEYPTKELIKEKLYEVHYRTKEFLSSLVLEDLDRLIDFPWGGNGRLGWIIWHVLEHEIHHRGELSLILGISGP
jgi:uncharacterized damage-inducible protein DinB